MLMIIIWFTYMYFLATYRLIKATQLSVVLGNRAWIQATRFHYENATKHTGYWAKLIKIDNHVVTVGSHIINWDVYEYIYGTCKLGLMMDKIW